MTIQIQYRHLIKNITDSKTSIQSVEAFQIFDKIKDFNIKEIETLKITSKEKSPSLLCTKSLEMKISTNKVNFYKKDKKDNPERYPISSIMCK